MSDSDPDLRVECPACDFRQVISKDGESVPADVIIAHGRETGHIVNVDINEQ